MARKKKITASTDNSGWVEPKKKKIRKRRKPMTEEQKAAAAQRPHRRSRASKPLFQPRATPGAPTTGPPARNRQTARSA